MGNFDNIIQEINTNIPDNNEQLITAEKIRSTLIDFVNEVDSNEDGIETSLQGKTDKVINATNGNFASLDEDGNLVDSGLNSDSFAEVFVGTVYRTTFDEISEALSDGKIVVLVEGNNTYYYVGMSNYRYVFFTFLGNFYSYALIGRDNIWVMDNGNMVESVNNKVFSLSSSSTNTEYPSAKCVYDTLTDYVQKSETVGLLKNDGTVDTSTYLTQEDISGKADKTPIETSLPLSGGILPNVVYMLGTLENDARISIKLKAPVDNTIANVYTVTFDTYDWESSGVVHRGPSVSWLLPLTTYWADGEAPYIEPKTCYEVSIMNDIAVCVTAEKVRILPVEP